MKIIFIGCVQFSCKLLDHLLATEDPNIEVVGVVTREASSFNADFKSLVLIAKKNDIPFFIAQGNDQEAMLSWCKEKVPDVVYCFGWSYLLKEPMLKFPKLGVVGYHPTLLPQHRGRHPIIWALALGLRETGSTFFFMDDNVDSGDILSQKKIQILDSDDACSLYAKLVNVACEQMNEFTPQLISGDFKRLIQDESKASYWCKRTKEDGVINWEMSAQNIHNLVRALTRPYGGAHFNYDGKEIKVWKTEIVYENDQMMRADTGRVLADDADGIIVKCGKGSLKLLDIDGGTNFKATDTLLQKNQTSVAVFSVVYRGVEPYIHQFFQSLAEQTDQNFKVFIVNDGMEDLETLLKEYDLDVEVLEQEGLPAELRKIGIKWAASRGAQKLIFLDADDYIANNRIEVSVKKLDECDIVFNELILVGEGFVEPVGMLDKFFDDKKGN